jgi:hypothetical protein
MRVLILVSCLVATSGHAAALTSYDRNYALDVAKLATGASPVPECWYFSNGFEIGVAGVPPPVSLPTAGGYRIVVDLHTITVTDPLGLNKVEHWGDPHENLNGKHIKDWAGNVAWDGTRRTIELGDGSRVTLEAYGAQGVVFRTSLYDGARNVQVDNCRNRVVHASSDPVDTATRDQLQYDGEIASFTTDAATGIATYENLGNEDAGFQYVATPQLLGTTGGYANPNNVRDFFDDPRLGHT